MEELDLLKKDWKKNEGRFPRVSEKEIYGMLHKGSSSIVKWILVISVLELLFWFILSYLLKDTSNAKTIEGYKVDYITVPLSLISYGIIFYFFCRFYINYRKITATDNVKTLMVTILKTRKTVSTYIIVNLIYIVICTIVMFVIMFNHDTNLINTLHKFEAQGDEIKFYLIYSAGAIICMGFFILVIWLFYKLIYGLLLKRLHRNYEELKKIDF
jgi:hypothetical protein